MKSCLPLFVLLVVLPCLGCSDSPPQQKPISDQVDSRETVVDPEQDKKQIHDCFYSYKRAILEDKGDKAFQCLDKRTRDYYAKILQLVKTANRDEVEQLSFLDKMQVLIMRNNIPKSELLSMTGDELLIYSINHGMVGKNGASNLEAGTITVEGEFGKMEIIVKQRNPGLVYHFYKEDGQWKLDLTSSFPMIQVGMKLLVKLSEQSENDFIMDVIREMPSKNPSNDIWEPIGK